MLGAGPTIKLVTPTKLNVEQAESKLILKEKKSKNQKKTNSKKVGRKRVKTLIKE